MNNDQIIVWILYCLLGFGAAAYGFYLLYKDKKADNRKEN